MSLNLSFILLLDKYMTVEFVWFGKTETQISFNRTRLVKFCLSLHNSHNTNIKICIILNYSYIFYYKILNIRITDSKRKIE